MVYIDTSVLVAYYSPEALSDSVQSYLRQHPRPAISTLTEVEFFSAVARKVRTQEIEKAAGNRIVAQLTAHIDSGLYTWLAMEHHHWKLARGWIGLFSVPLRTLDALHLALASVQGLELVTSDIQLFQAAEALAVKARLLQ